MPTINRELQKLKMYNRDIAKYLLYIKTNGCSSQNTNKPSAIFINLEGGY